MDLIRTLVQQMPRGLDWRWVGSVYPLLQGIADTLDAVRDRILMLRESLRLRALTGAHLWGLVRTLQVEDGRYPWDEGTGEAGQVGVILSGRLSPTLAGIAEAGAIWGETIEVTDRSGVVYLGGGVWTHLRAGGRAGQRLLTTIHPGAEIIALARARTAATVQVRAV